MYAPGGHPIWVGLRNSDSRDVDQFKKAVGFPKKVPPALMEKVKAFYKAEFWDPMKCDLMPDEIADEMFDTGVNQGPGQAALYLQQALNLLNRNATLYPDLKEDGKVGQNTISALTTYLRKDTAMELLVWMNVLQGAKYAAIMQADPSQEKYARGWSKRIVLTKGNEAPVVEADDGDIALLAAAKEHLHQALELLGG